MVAVAATGCGRCGKPKEFDRDEFGPYAHCAPCGLYEYENVSEDMIAGTYLYSTGMRIPVGHYPKDKGCQVSSSCATCPLEDCIQENGTALVKWKNYHRWTGWSHEVVAKVSEGYLREKAIQEVAAAHGVIERTVYRAMKRLREAA